SGPFGTSPFLGAFLKALGRPKLEPPGPLPERRRPLTLPSPPSDGGEGRVRGTDATARLKRQCAQILHHSDRLLDASPHPPPGRRSCRSAIQGRACATTSPARNHTVPISARRSSARSPTSCPRQRREHGWPTTRPSSAATRWCWTFSQMSSCTGFCCCRRTSS